MFKHTETTHSMNTKAQHTARITFLLMIALCVLCASCGGGGGGGGGDSGSAPWGNTKTLKIDLNDLLGSSSRASARPDTLAWTQIDLKVYINDAVAYDESILQGNNDVIRIEHVQVGSKAYAEATIHIQDEPSRVAKSDTVTIEAGTNKLTLYVPYNVKFNINTPTGTPQYGIFTQNGGQTLETTFLTKSFSFPQYSKNTGYSEYLIDYWYTDITNPESSRFTFGGAGDINELYAHWTKEGYIIINKAVSGSPVFIAGRTVEIPEKLWVCDHEVTQQEYQQYCTYSGTYSPNATYGVGNDYPAYYVSWYDALVYCNKRSLAENLTPCYAINGSTNPTNWGSVPTANDTTWNNAICDFGANGYRLPTEAEWEYAVRGKDLNGPQYSYSGSDNAADVAWVASNGGTHPVKQKNPNGAGLYDMSGNVWEWCWDWQSNNINTSTPSTGVTSGSNRCLRGSDWSNTGQWASPYQQNGEPPYKIGKEENGSITPYYGFRVVRSKP